MDRRLKVEYPEYADKVSRSLYSDNLISKSISQANRRAENSEPSAAYATASIFSKYDISRESLVSTNNQATDTSLASVAGPPSSYAPSHASSPVEENHSDEERQPSNSHHLPEENIANAIESTRDYDAGKGLRESQYDRIREKLRRVTSEGTSNNVMAEAFFRLMDGPQASLTDIPEEPNTEGLDASGTVDGAADLAESDQFYSDIPDIPDIPDIRKSAANPMVSVGSTGTYQNLPESPGSLVSFRSAVDHPDRSDESEGGDEGEGEGEGENQGEDHGEESDEDEFYDLE